MKQTLEMRVIQRAAELLGGEPALARRIQVPIHDIQMWVAGTELPTRASFLAAVDVLVERGDMAALDAFAAMPPNQQDAANAEQGGFLHRASE